MRYLPSSLFFVYSFSDGIVKFLELLRKRWGVPFVAIATLRGRPRLFVLDESGFTDAILEEENAKEKILSGDLSPVEKIIKRPHIPLKEVLYIEDEPVALVLSSREIDEEEKRKLYDIVPVYMVYLEVASRESEVRSSLERCFFAMDHLHNAVSSLSGASSKEDWIKRALKVLVSIVSSKGGEAFFLKFDEETDRFFFVATDVLHGDSFTANFPLPHFLRVDGSWLDVLSSKDEPIIVDSAFLSKVPPEERKFLSSFRLAVPVKRGIELEGFFLLRERIASEFSSLENKVLNLLTLHLKESYYRVKALEEHLLDPFTRVYSWTYTEARLREEMKRVARFRGEFSVAFLGVTALPPTRTIVEERILLKKIAKQIKDTLRESDVVCGYGPNYEMVLLFSATPPKNAKVPVERTMKVLKEKFGKKLSLVALIASPTEEQTYRAEASEFLKQVLPVFKELLFNKEEGIHYFHL